MPEYNIKISELNDIMPNPPFTEDFFPLVHSQSMTTYKATIRDIGSLMTHSIYADTASYYSGGSTIAISASWASSSISASYAKTASWAMYTIPQISCSWASRSISSSHSDYSDSASYAKTSSWALYANDVAFKGYNGYVPIWWSSSNDINIPLNTLNDIETPFNSYELTSRGNLKYKSKLYIGPLSQSVSGQIVTIDPDYSLNSSDYLPVPIETWYTASGGYKYQNSMYAGGIGNGGGGLNTKWAIISQDFVGTDRQYYAIATASYYDQVWQYTDKIWSGSLKDGSYKVFVPNTMGQMSNVFNKKWLRIACWSAASQYYVTTNAARGELQGIPGTSDLYGRIRLDLHTPNAGPYTGTNTWQVIDMNILNQVNTDGGKSVTVNAASIYTGPDIIKMIRLSSWPTPGNIGVDPYLALDIFIDGLTSDVNRILIQLQSWNGVRFLKELNLDPPPLVNTGSSPYPQQSTYLTFPPEPGVYSNANYSSIGTQKFRNYNIQGMPVVIWPTLNERTGSVRDNPQFASSINASLNVSGTINTNQQFACNDHLGITTTVTWGTTNLYFEGGILINKYTLDPNLPPVVTPTSDVCVIGICNSDQIMDNKYTISLNGNFIGYYDGGANLLRNSLFLGNMTDAITQASQNAVDVTCKGTAALVARTTYRFSPSFLISGTNTLIMTYLSGYTVTNYGAIKILRQRLNTGTGVLSEVSTLLNTTYYGISGASITRTFTWS